MAQRRFGSGTSSLLRSASAAAEKTATYNDQIAAYEFDLSEKSQEDFDKYSKYLQGRISKVQALDPSKALSLQKTLTSSYRKFNSSEIFRASLAVNYGEATNRDKYAKMYSLFQNALANGDESLAQSIEGQLGRLSVTIQNEEMAAANRAAAGRAASSAKAYTSEKKEFDNALRSYDQQLASGQISPNDYALKVAQTYKYKENFLQRAESAGHEKASDDLLALQANDSFQKFTSPALVEKIGRGEDLLALKKDAYGNYKLVERKNVGIDGDPLGYDGNRPLAASQYQTGVIKDQGKDNQGGIYENLRKLGSNFGHAQHEFAFNKDTGLREYSDISTGRPMLISSDGLRNYAKDPDKNAPDAQLLRETAQRLAKNNGQVKNSDFDYLKNFIGPDPIKNAIDYYTQGGNAIKDTTDAIKGIFKSSNRQGTIGGANNPLGMIQRLYDFGNVKRAEAQAKADEAARVQAQQAATRAAQLRALPGPPPLLPGPRITQPKEYQQYFGAGPIAQQITKKAPPVVSLINKLTGFGSKLRF